MKKARRIVLSVLSVILVLLLALSTVACSDPDFDTKVDYTYVTLGQYPARHLSDRTIIITQCCLSVSIFVTVCNEFTKRLRFLTHF